MGYGYRTGAFGYGTTAADDTAVEHLINVGIRYDRPLSPTRRTVLDFNIGSSVVNPSRSTGAQLEADRLHRVTGDVGVIWQFSKAWHARGAFRRGLEYVAGLSDPVFIDGYTASVDGLPLRRLDVSASAGYSSGASAVARDSLTFDTYTANLRVQFALVRSLAVVGEYLYYFYDLRNPPLASSIPPRLERHGVRAGVTLWVPALRR
jgi:hypothetical protein